MNRLATLLVLTLWVSASACTKVSHEVNTPDKRAPVARNILLFSSETPADIRIAYYATEDGVTNRLIEREVQTPYILELEDAVAIYDSMHFYSGHFCKKLLYGYRRYKQTRERDGPEYLRVENLSGQVVKLVAIDTKELQTEWVPEYEETVITDEHPLPLYKGVPLLYLLKPERAPGRELGYVATSNYRSPNGGGRGTTIEQIPLFPDRLGIFRADDLPFSIKRIVELHEREMKYLLIHYDDYSEVEKQYVSIDDIHQGFQVFAHHHHFEPLTHIAPHTTLVNAGSIPMMAMDFQRGMNGEGNDRKDYHAW